MNNPLVTDRICEPVAHALLRHPEDRKLAAGSPRESTPSRDLAVPALFVTRRSLPQLRWMTRACVLLVILCLLLAAWVWSQILRMSFS